MSKELEALERIKKAPVSYKEETPRFAHTYLQDLDIIETTLKRLKEIDEWKTSYQIPNDEELRRYIHNGWVYENKGEKQIKALEIIKKKKVNLEYLKCCETYEQYKTICSYWSEITNKEFELLKEVLKYV